MRLLIIYKWCSRLLPLFTLTKVLIYALFHRDRVNPNQNLSLNPTLTLTPKPNPNPYANAIQLIVLLHYLMLINGSLLCPYCEV